MGDEDFRFLAPILGFDGSPNFEEHSYTLYLTDSFQRNADELGMSRSELLDRVEPLLAKLARERAMRPFPLVDDKVLTDWNGMVIAALAEAGRLLGEDRYTEAAVGGRIHPWAEGLGTACCCTSGTRERPSNRRSWMTMPF